MITVRSQAPEIPERGRPCGQGRRARLAATAVLVLLAAGCQSRSPETTGSIGSGLSALGFGGGTSGPRTISRREVDALGAKYTSDPNDLGTAMRYAQGLRATEQTTQAVAVLQQAALRNPKNSAVLAAYGKALAEVGRLQEAAEVLQNAHTPAQPDWRVLSAQGSVADQLGDHARAQAFYDAALKIRPDEPTILSNLGLSYALARRLDQAESTLRRAVGQPGADARVRQNLALVLGLKGRFPEAEATLREVLPPEEAAANAAALRALVAQPNSWKAIQAADKTARKANPPRG
ncbi:tetratricopeptide repeat protein [Methylobacterium nigriterrae]|uniref:tetratricopeptide repeat protein n=1 Tax=Methylobacterium nigriterrae TaxID=3127512 RepID=UPI003013E324